MQGRQTTLSDVAARAGVSPATVSRVLNGNYPVAEATRERVLEAVRHYDYVLNVHARTLVHAQSGIVGIVLADVSDPFFSEIVRGVQSVTAGSGRLAMICNTGGDPDEELSYVNLLRNHRADAVVLVGAGSTSQRVRREVARHAEGLARQGSGLVLAGRPLPVPGAPAAVVDLDNHGAAEQAMLHLVACGHRRILHLAGPAGSTTTTARSAGVRAAARAAGLGQVVTRAGDLSRTAGESLVAAALAREEDFTAVLASNDLMAIGALVALRKAGVRVPEQVSVIGIDDIPVASDVTPALTTVHLPLVELGAEAGRLAVGTALRDRGVVPGGPAVGTGPSAPLPARLVERESVGPVPRDRPRA